ncbi:hypothetical protein JCM17960_14080 [Magnetospira thiophila]
MTDLSPAALAHVARPLYARGSLLLRLIQGYRPLICPFGQMIDMIPAGARVLDVGCGSGLFLALLAHADRIGAGHGVDMSPMAIDVALHMKAVHPRGDRLTFECRSAQEAWPEGEYDVVSFVDLLHHVPPGDQTEVLRQAAAKVRPGGLFLYKDVGRRPRWRATASILHDLVIARQWIHIPDMAEIQTLMVALGFEQLEFQAINMWWYGHELALFRRAG